MYKYVIVLCNNCNCTPSYARRPQIPICVQSYTLYMYLIHNATFLRVLYNLLRVQQFYLTQTLIVFIVNALRFKVSRKSNKVITYVYISVIKQPQI